MSKPVVFLSSTIRDLEQLRKNMEIFLEEREFEIVRSEIGSIPYGNIGELEKDCYREVGSSDLLISILSSQYGSQSYNKNYSITQLEIKTALKLNKFVYIFIKKEILTEYFVYLKNKHYDFKPNTVSNKKIFDFITEIKSQESNAIIHQYSFEQDIILFLKKQWAGLLKRQFQQINRTITEKESIENFILRDIKDFTANGQAQSVFWYKKIFSGFLWHKGKLNERIKLGEYVAETASQFNDYQYLSEALVDDIGWSWVLLKELEKAEKHIQQGKRIAEENHITYYSIKSERHLSAIDFERGNIDEAIEKLNRISSLTIRQLKGKNQIKMLFGIEYGKTKIYILDNEYDLALESISNSRALAREMNNEFKINMTYSLEGKIYELKNELFQAIQIYLKGLKVSEELSMYDEMIKNCAGLISSYKKEGKKERANDYINRAKQYKELNTLPFEIGDSIFNINELINNNEKITTIIRHGFCEKNENKIIGGEDSVLLPEAFEDLETSFSTLKDVRYDIIICSPKSQCVETAEFLSKRLSIPYKVNSGLKAASMGIADGLSESELESKYPKYFNQLVAWRNREIEVNQLSIPKMTNPHSFFQNGVRFLDKIYKDYNSILIVGTSSTIICLVNILQGNDSKSGGNYKAINFSNSDFITFSKNGENNVLRQFSTIMVEIND